MRKIGLLTYFWANNPGTFLQAYTTLEALKKRFPKDQVELINYKLIRGYFKPDLMHINPGKLIKDLRRYYKYMEARLRYLTIGQETLVTWDYQRALQFIKKLKYDLIVVGSDTILDFLPNHLKRKTTPVYWLPPEINCQKVMCGSSAKALVYDNLTDIQRNLLSESVRGFELMAVRDEATYNLIKALGIRDEEKLCRIPDPTFSWEIDYSFVEAFIKSIKIDLSKPLIMISLPEWYQPAYELASYYRSKGFQIIRLEYAKYANLCLHDISPFEWAGIYRYFDLVITDRFHGTLFSLKNGTPVVSVICRKDLINSRGLSKYYSLLELFGLHKTNIVNGMEMLDVDQIIKVTEQARQNFPKDIVKTKLKELKDIYNAFVDKIP